VAGSGVDGYSGDGGPATSAALRAPAGVTFSGGNLMVADSYAHTVRNVDSGGTISTLAGTGVSGFSGDGGPATAARLGQPGDVVKDAAGNLYIADFLNSRIRKVAPDGTINTFAGTGSFGYTGDSGPALLARLASPVGLDIDAAGNLYVADVGNHTVRRITPAGIISTVAGNGSGGSTGDGGPATSAQLYEPADVTLDDAGNLYVPEYSGHRVRKVATTGTISTIAGTGSSGYSGDGGPALLAQMSAPTGVAVDSQGQVFVAERNNHVIRKIDSSGTITRVAGTGFSGYSGDGGPATLAQLQTPARVTLGPGGDFYISDFGNHRVRLVDDLASADAPTLTGTVPASPSSSNNPLVQGSAPTGSTVRLYTNSTCTSAVAATGTAAVLASPGLGVTVPDDSSSTFWATATDSGGNVSGCSTSSVTYLEDSTAPAVPTIDSSPTTPDNDVAPSWSFSGEAGAAFECRLVRGATVISDWAACSDPRTYDLSAELDGLYTFLVRARDSAGNTGSVASSSYELDTTAPAAPTIDAAPATPDSNPFPSWSFSAEAGAALECRLERGAFLVSDWTSCTSPEVYDLASQPDSLYTFSVRARDAAGNTGAAASDDYILDRTAPAAPSIDSSSSSPGNDVTPSWSFSGEAGASFECRLERGATVISDWAACSDPRTYDLSTEPDGLYVFSVRARDAAGNLGPSAGSSYLLDTQAPGIPSIDSAPSSPGNDSTPTWSFSGEAGAAFECRLERGATVVSDWAACSNPRTYDLSAEPDDNYSFSVRARDAAGNSSGAAGSAYDLDTVAPSTPTIDAPPPSPGNDRTPEWSFSGEVGASLECRLQRGAVVVSDWAACSSPRVYDLTAEPDGTYTFLVRAGDAAGNLSAADSSDYVLDANVPSVPQIDSSPGPVGADPTPSWGFSGDAGSSFECRLERGATLISDWASCSSPATFDLSGQPDGLYTFLVRAVSLAGNRSTPASDDYRLDRIAPPAPSIDAAPASPGNGTSPSWSFSGEAGASFECRLASGAGVVSDWSPCTSPSSYDLSGQPDDTYSFSVRARDAAGNTGPAASSDYVLDTQAPAAPSIDSAPVSPGTGQSLSWSFSGEPGAGFECRLVRGAAVVSDWSACSSPRAYDLSSEPDGTYTVSVRARDAAGNTGPAATSDYVLDTSGATVQIDSGPGAVGNGRAPSWSFSAEPGASFECRLERDGAALFDWSGCSSPRGYDLSGQPDASYLFSVRARDALGNLGTAVSSSYQLDTLPPGAPVVETAPGSPGRDRGPAWSFSTEPGATVECRLDGGGAFGWSACASPHSYDLASAADGSYMLSLRATDAAGNTGASASSAYELDTTAPDAPVITDGPPATGDDRRPAWSFTGEPGAVFECALARGRNAVSKRAACASPREYNLVDAPDGDYDFSVRARDAAGNVGQAAGAGYVLDRADEQGDGVPPNAVAPDEAPADPSPAELEPDADSPAADFPPDANLGSKPSAGQPGGPAAGADSSVMSPRQDEVHGLGQEQEGGSPVLKALGRAVEAVAKNADKTVFPGLLAAIVMCFFALQNRIDRNDPKLGLAPVFADPDLEFRPPERKQ
jgi:hypothetical protein